MNELSPIFTYPASIAVIFALLVVAVVIVVAIFIMRNADKVECESCGAEDFLTVTDAEGSTLLQCQKCGQWHKEDLATGDIKSI